MLLAGKKLLITGVLTPGSIAYDCARIAQDEGAEVLLTGFGRGMSLTQRSARRLTPTPEVLEVDVNNGADLVALTGELQRRWGRLDGCLHAIAYAPPDTIGGRFMTAPWESVEVALRTSTFSLKELACAVTPLMGAGGSIVSLTFDNRFAWPAYDWMGVCKSGLESVARYLARDLGPRGIRVNTVAAGPLATIAAKAIPGLSEIKEAWQKAPLGWDIRDPEPVARMVAVLLSDWAPATTGEMVHVDGGYHAMG